MSESDREDLRRKLAAAGLPATEEDIEAQLHSTYPAMRDGVELLHEMPEAREEVPALVFDPDPPPGSWHEPVAERAEETR